MFCDNVGGWVPYNEFMDLPISTFNELCNAAADIQKEKKKFMEKSKKSRRR